MEPWTSDNRFLGRAFEPVFDERNDEELLVEGELPSGLHGVFMRNGPNPQFKPDDQYAYPFDGTGMVHAVYLEGGRARYRNRWVLTEELAQERAAGRRLFNSTFSGPPNANLANTNIIHHAGRYLALYEGGLPYVLNKELDTAGKLDFDGRLQGVMSAHPKVDPGTNELLSVQGNLETGQMLYMRLDRAGRIDRMVPFMAPWPAMVHDIGITQQYVLAFVNPLVFDFSSSGPPASWQPDNGTLIAVIPRDATSAEQVTWVKGPPFFNWHVVNAHENGPLIETVVHWYDNFSLAASARRLELHRIVIDTVGHEAKDETIDDSPCEFGRINDAYLGRKARYAYVGFRDQRPGIALQPGAFEAIAKYDLATGEKTLHRFPDGSTVGEPVFVADPEGRSEDDGFILTFVHEQGKEGGQFCILDARNLESEPVAMVRLPRRVPAGLHGSWIPVA